MEIDFQLDSSWTLRSIAGDTGKTYMGIRKTEKVFIKRNTTPFLAALSREGVAPKLLWTKRTGTGDVITAQEWLEGHVLSSKEVGSRKDVIKILSHLHHSQPLKSMLVKVGGTEQTAFDFLREYADDLTEDLKQHTYLYKIFRYLEDHMPSDNELTVCHGDPVHPNWYETEDNRLYLVDWDNCVLADPAYDLAIILGRYVPKEHWAQWLVLYGENPSEELIAKIYWYVGMHYLLRVKYYHQQRNEERMNEEIAKLKKYFSFE